MRILKLQLQVTKAPNGQNLSHGTVQFGQATVGAEVDASVNKDERRAIQKNHSATHLLHQALKEVLGRSCQPSRFISRS